MIKRWEYAKPEYVFPPTHAAYMVMALLLVGYNLGLQFLVRTQKENSNVFFLLLALMFLSPAWLLLGILYKTIYLRQFTDYPQIVFRLSLPFLTILAGPVLATVFRKSLYDSASSAFFSVFYYGPPVSAVFWDFCCKYVIIDRYKFLLSCTLGLLFFISPLLIFLPLYLKDPQTIYLVLWATLLSCLGLSLLVVFCLQLYQFSKDRLLTALASLKEIRKMVR